MYEVHVHFGDGAQRKLFALYRVLVTLGCNKAIFAELLRLAGDEAKYTLFKCMSHCLATTA